MTDKNANTEIRKEFCPNCEAETPCTHEAELDEIITRLKEDAERLADGMIISPENEGDFCSYCGGMEHVDDCPITLHRALMKELAEC